MAYGNIVLTPNYELTPTRTRTLHSFNSAGAIAHLYTIFAASFALTLICLALRVIFALFIVEGELVRAVVAFTNPLVTPFSDIFHDNQSMIQVSTMTAFTVYYLIYGITSKYLSFIRHHLPA